MELEITIHGQHFTLHTSGAVYWKEENMLIISDVHLGKVMHFRKHGMAIPTASVSANFTNLSEVADHFKPSTMCFLGDLFHSSLNNEWFLFENWVKTRPEKQVLVQGNHDIISTTAYHAIGVETTREWIIGPFLLIHEPQLRDGYFIFCGHVHPAVRLNGAGKQQIVLPCFFKSDNQFILPAFGTFTGRYVVQPQVSDTIYAIADKELVILHGEAFNRN